MLIAVAIITWVLSYVIQGFSFGLILQTISTVMLILRLKAVRVKKSRFTVCEILSIAIPTLFALIFKRFSIIKLVKLVVVRGIFYLYVLYDFENYRYFTREFTQADDEISNEVEE